MVGPKRIASRISELEAKLKGPPRKVCPDCGAHDGGRTITERHDLDGNITYFPHAPCSGCVRLIPPGVINHILICGLHAHGLDCPHCGPVHPLVAERARYLRGIREERNIDD